jgi:branched-chain amino acid transport system substrate-binding protein
MRKSRYLILIAVLLAIGGLVPLMKSLSTPVRAAPDPDLLQPNSVAYDTSVSGVGTSSAISVTKSVVPEGMVDYGDPLTYTVVVSAARGTQIGLYDPLTETTFLRFAEQPTGVVHIANIITGTLEVTPTNRITISFVAKVGVPGTVGWTMSVNNRACVYPAGGTLMEDCIWSNEVKNEAFHPYQVYLPFTARNYEKTLTLGVLGPFSGPSSRTGEKFKDAVNMAFDEVDWRVKGYKIDLVWIDSESDYNKAPQAYEQAITQDGVQAGLLNWHSSVAVGCMDVVAEHKIPHFAGLGASGVVNDVFNGDQEKYGYWTTKWWPTPGKLNISYLQMLEDAIDSGHWSPSEKTVIIYGEDTDWGHAFGDGIKANFEDAGWSVVAEEYFPYDQTDFTDLMNTLNNLNPAVVAGTTSGDSAAAFINQADATGLNSVIIADGLGWTGDWYGQTGSSSDYVVDQIPGWASAESQAFKQAFEDRYGYTPSPSSGGLAYDAANFFIGVAQATYEQYGKLSSETLYSFTQDQIWTGQWTYTDGVMMEEYKYTDSSIPDPVLGVGYYTFPVRQYFDGEGKIIFPPDWAEQPFTPPGE